MRAPTSGPAFLQLAIYSLINPLIAVTTAMWWFRLKKPAASLSKYSVTLLECFVSFFAYPVIAMPLSELGLSHMPYS